MRIVRSAEEMPNQFRAATSEAAGAFGNGDLYMEKFVERPRHIEFQMLCDEHGNTCAWASATARCSAATRSSSKSRLRRGLPRAAHEDDGAAREDVQGGWLLERGHGRIPLRHRYRQPDFMEVNTRIQVEHPVTEYVTGVDLVKSQILHRRRGQLTDIVKLPIDLNGHAMECRINAEHPEKFTPSAGKITVFNPPGGIGVRVDSVQYQEGVVSPYYDSMIAKFIVHGKDRAEAMARMKRALDMFIIEGIHPRFRCTRDFGGSGLHRGQRHHQIHGTLYAEEVARRKIKGRPRAAPFLSSEPPMRFHFSIPSSMPTV